MNAQADEGLIVWVAIIVLIACVIIALSSNLIPMLFKAIKMVLFP